MKRSVIDSFIAVSSEIKRMEKVRESLRGVILPELRNKQVLRGKLGIVTLTVQPRESLDRERLTELLVEALGAEEARRILSEATKRTEVERVNPCLNRDATPDLLPMWRVLADAGSVVEKEMVEVWTR